MKYTLIGLAFAMLWASASTATKFGLQTAQPLLISDVRFFLAGFLMLTGAHILRGYRLPQKPEWLPLSIYGFLNVTLYLGLFSVGIKYASAGIGTLMVAINPLLISILSAFWLKKHISLLVWIGLFLGIMGVAIATYPLLADSHASPLGIVLLFASMLSYSVGTLYYSQKKWDLPILAINGWQVLLGGLFLVPFTLLTTVSSQNNFNGLFWASVLWLVIAVSYGAVQLWLYLLKIDPIKASLWLFLCPIFGFIYAAILLKEPITIYTGVGTILVILGLYLGQKKEKV